ncbi:hypothetical protein J6590_015171 [Homalodisca vitripennis]|nr:hypothetical protein J6590_015171 [Homalodisca vitripennis]
MDYCLLTSAFMEPSHRYQVTHITDNRTRCVMSSLTKVSLLHFTSEDNAIKVGWVSCRVWRPVEVDRVTDDSGTHTGTALVLTGAGAAGNVVVKTIRQLPVPQHRSMSYAQMFLEHPEITLLALGHAGSSEGPGCQEGPLQNRTMIQFLQKYLNYGCVNSKQSRCSSPRSGVRTAMPGSGCSSSQCPACTFPPITPLDSMGRNLRRWRTVSGVPPVVLQWRVTSTQEPLNGACPPLTPGEHSFWRWPRDSTW